MLEAFNNIHEFNRKADLLSDGYNDFKEAEYCIEEALEGFDTTYLAIKLHLPEASTPKDISRAIVTGHCTLSEPIPDVDRFDKALDGIFFNFGAIFKLRLSVYQAIRGLLIVCKANLTKLTVGKDAHGKQMKPTDFVGPEAELQKILDERNGSL